MGFTTKVLAMLVTAYYAKKKWDQRDQIKARAKQMWTESDFAYADTIPDFDEHSLPLLHVVSFHERWFDRLLGFVAVLAWLSILQRRGQTKQMLSKIDLIQHPKNPRYSGELLVRRMDGLEFRSLISDVSIDRVNSEDHRPNMSVKITNFNPLNQQKDYSPDKLDKSLLRDSFFTLLMDDLVFDKELAAATGMKTSIVPDLLFATT